jgi:glutamate formiminotransferase/formiminotetrahydrofolate cyclodeaminase
MDLLGREAQTLKDWFLAAVDRDTEAFNAVMAAMRMPRKSEGDRMARDAAMTQATLAATIVPLEVLERTVQALELSYEAARNGNPNSVSDAGVAAACAVAAAKGASLNVRINLPGLDEDEHRQLLERHDAALAQAVALGDQVAATVDEVLEQE